MTTISTCLITLNSESMLDVCLDSVKDFREKKVTYYEALQEQARVAETYLYEDHEHPSKILDTGDIPAKSLAFMRFFSKEQCK